MTRNYHHGNLRAQVLTTAAELVADQGADAISLRDLARRAEVSHAAPAHHFGDRRGLFTALAAEGFELLAAALEPTVSAREFDQSAVAYVRFATTHPGHFAVMFRADLLDQHDSTLNTARSRAGELLEQGLDTIADDRLRIARTDARRAAWALVHGAATLWLAGAMPDTEPEHLALTAAHQLFAGKESGLPGD